jgi:hypothetical protein
MLAAGCRNEEAQQEKAEDYGLATYAWDMGLRRVSDSAGALNGLVFSVLAGSPR